MDFIKKHPEYFVLALLACCYIIAVAAVPGYYIDDFYIYSKIESERLIVSADPNDFCYLFYRPVYFLFASLEYNILGNNPVLLKLASFILLAVSLYFISAVIRNASQLFNMKFSSLTMALIIAAAGLHTTVLFDVLWLSAKNELLLMMFLVLSVYSLLKYLIKGKGFYLVLYIVFFTASLLSKQQAAVLPLCLFGIYLLWKDKFRKYPSSFLTAVWISFFISTAYSVYFYLGVSPEHSFFLENLWKKPFVIAASALYAVSPFLGDTLYPFFIQNKLIALLLLILILSFFAYLWKAKKDIKPLLIIKLLAVYIITTLPVLFISFSERLITVQIIFFVLIVPFIVFKGRTSGVTFYAVLIAVIGLNIFYSFGFSRNMADYFLLNRKMISELEQIKSETGRNIVIVSDMDLDTPYKTGYFTKNVFRQDSSIIQIPVFYQPVFDYRQFSIVNDSRRMFTAELTGDELKISSESADYCIAVNDKILKDRFGGKLIQTGTENHGIKFYKSVRFRVLDPSLFKNNKAVFFNGEGWEALR